MVVGEKVDAGEVAGAVRGAEAPLSPASPDGPPPAVAALAPGQQQNQQHPPNIHNIMGGMQGTTGVRLHNHRKKLKQRFDIVKKLGQGTYGKVQLGINKETGQEVAIKTIKKAKIETEADLIRIRREIQIMSSVQHPNIIHIYEVFENREKMVLVMEYAAGGELYDYLSERKVLAETEARRIFRQIATAVYYCHKHKICHRDLKLENILLDENGNAKIADFGLSNVFDETRLLSTFCGSPLYASPEIVRGTPYHGPEVDCWSLGVLLYTLVYGAMPFDGSNFKRLVKQISQGDYFEPKKPSPASPLIRAILTVNPRRRADIEAICSHWWVNEGYEGSGDGVPSCLEEAEELASRTPVRLDLLLSLVPPPAPGAGTLVVGAEAPADGALPTVNAAVTGVPEMGNGDVVCQPVPPRSHSVGSFMDLEYHGTPSRMPPFVPPERRKAKAGGVLEKEAPQKRKLEGGGASGVCVPKRIDEEGRKEDEEERGVEGREVVGVAMAMGVSGVLREEEEDELKAEEECTVGEAMAAPSCVVPVVGNEVESMEVDEMTTDVSAVGDKSIPSELVKEAECKSGEEKATERTAENEETEEKTPIPMTEEPSQPVVVGAAEAAVGQQEIVEPVSEESQESGKVEVVSEAKSGENGVCEKKMAVPGETEEVEGRTAVDGKVGEEKVEVEKPKEQEKEEKTATPAEAKERDEAEEERKKAAKALARKRLSLKIPKKATGGVASTDIPPPMAMVGEGSKVPEGKVLEVKQDKVSLPSKDASPKSVAPKTTERRRSQAFERFNSLVAAASSPSPDSPTADKPKKVFIPGIKVSDAKRAFEKKTTTATAVIKVNKPTSAKIIPPSPQSKADLAPSSTKKKDEDLVKRESLNKSPKDKECSESILNNGDIGREGEGQSVLQDDSLKKQPNDQKPEKFIKEDVNSTPQHVKVAAVQSSVESKGVVQPKEEESTKSSEAVCVPPTKGPPQTPQEPANIPSATTQLEQVEKEEKPSENAAANSVAVSQQSPLIENPPVWSKSATLPRRVPQPKLRGVPVPFGQHQPQYKPPQQQQKPEDGFVQDKPLPQQPIVPEPTPPPQVSTAPCQYSTAVEYTLKPELEGFPGELSFTISQGMPTTTPNSIGERKEPTETVMPPFRRVARPITRHPTAPATFLRSSSLGPTPSSAASSRGVERIIPIRMERDEARETSRSTSQTTSEDSTPTPNTSSASQRPPLHPQGSQIGPRGEQLSRQSTQESDSGETGTPVPGPEPIRKSPREFIIPIAMEGGGYVTPRAGSMEPSGAGEERQDTVDPWHQFPARAGRLARNKRLSSSMRSESGASEDESNSVSSPPPTFNGNPFDDENVASVSSSTATTPGVARPFHMHRLRSSRPNRRLLEHSDSFSSAEEDDDDGFEILTAESLFSTLLSRVRSLTQRLNVDDGSTGAGTGPVGMSSRSSHIFPTASRLLGSTGLHHHGTTHHLGSLGSSTASPGLFSSSPSTATASSFRSPPTPSSSSLMDWPHLHTSRAGESLSRRLSESSRFSDPSRYSRSLSGGGISPGMYSSSTGAATASGVPWRRNVCGDSSLDGDKGGVGSWRSVDTESPSGSSNSLGTFVARGSDSGDQEDRRKDRTQDPMANARPSFVTRFTPSLAKRIQSQQDPPPLSSCPPNGLAPPPASSSSSSLSSSSSTHQQNLRRLSSVLSNNNGNPSCDLPPVKKEAMRNGTALSDVAQMGHSFYSKMNAVPMSPSEEELPPHFGRRFDRQTSWNDVERRPSSYYDGLRSPDSDRRDERMASLEALRKRREIPVTLRTRSSSLGRDPVAIMNDAIGSKKNKNEPLSSRGGTSRNIADIRSRSSSAARDASVDSGERSRRGTSSSLVDSLESSSEWSRRGTSSVNDSLEGSDRSRRGTSSFNNSRSNSPDRSAIDRFFQAKERQVDAFLAARVREGASRGEVDHCHHDGREDKVKAEGRGHVVPRPHSLNLSSGGMAQSWNGGPPCVAMDPKIEEAEGKGKEASDEGLEGTAAKKKGRHRISRFLRPDFFDTPREESAFAKKKEAEAEAAAAAEKEKKQKESLKTGFLHSLERQLDRLRGGERSRKVAPVESECPASAMDGAIPPECLTSAKLAAEVRKAKSVGPEDVANPDGGKRASSRVDRAINSLLQREKGKEVSESGLIKRAVRIEERARPSKSRSSGELAQYGVCGGSSLGRLLANERNSFTSGGEANGDHGKGTDNAMGGRLSSKVNSVLGMFRRNDSEQATPLTQSKRVRRTQSLAYDKNVPEDILTAASDFDVSKSERIACNTDVGAGPKPQPTQSESVAKKTGGNKTEKVKKSSKAAKEKSNAAKSKTLVQKEKETTKIDKTSEETCKECSNERSPLSKRDNKKEKIVEPTPESKSYNVTVTLPRPMKRESGGNTANSCVKTPSAVVPEFNSLLSSAVDPNERCGNGNKIESLKNLGCCSAKSQIRPQSESKPVMSKELQEPPQMNGAKQLDRTATQDSLDSSSWSACSDIGVGEAVSGGQMGDVPLPRPPSPGAPAERLACGDDDSEESVGDRIRRKSFYCRFNDVPLRRRTHRPGRQSSSLIYSASDLWSAEGTKPKLSSSQIRDGFSPPLLAAKKPMATIYKRSSTSPYHDQLPSSSEATPLRTSIPTKGLRPTSSASSLAQSNGSILANEDGHAMAGPGERSSHLTPISPSSSCAYQNGILPMMNPNNIPSELERKVQHRLRKFRVPSLADGVIAPSPTHRKYNDSSHCSSEGLASVRGTGGSSHSGPPSLLPEKTPQVSNPSHLPPLGISLPIKMKAMHNS